MPVKKVYQASGSEQILDNAARAWQSGDNGLGRRGPILIYVLTPHLPASREEKCTGFIVRP